MRPFVVVQRHAGHAALVLGVRQRLHEHPPGERVIGVRPEIAGLVPQIADGLHQLRLRGIGRDIEDPDPVLGQPARPDVAAVVGESHVVRLGPRAGGGRVDDLAVALRLRIHIHRDELVGAVSQPLHAERPDVDVVLLALDQLGDIRRIAGFVGAYHGGEPHADHGEHTDYANNAFVVHGFLLGIWLARAARATPSCLCYAWPVTKDALHQCHLSADAVAKGASCADHRLGPGVQAILRAVLLPPSDARCRSAWGAEHEIPRYPIRVTPRPCPLWADSGRWPSGAA